MEPERDGGQQGPPREEQEDQGMARTGAVEQGSSGEGAETYFVPVGPDTYLPTEHAGGAWREDELHISPVAALLVHHLERWRAQHADPEKRFSRLSIDILGTLGRGEIALSTTMQRPGRTIELTETTAVIAGRHTLTARAWALSTSDTAEAAGTEHPALPGPEGLPERTMLDVWSGGFIRSVTVRDAEPPRPGRARSWVRGAHGLVAGEEAGQLARFLLPVDTANGIAVRRDPREWMFPNLDLTVHLFRRPAGEWTGLDTRVSFGPDGQGLTSSVLHDQDGPVGTVAQILTVRPHPAAG